MGAVRRKGKRRTPASASGKPTRMEPPVFAKLNTKSMGTSRRRSTPVEFEVAHQFATDGIRFALKHTSLYCPRSDRFTRLDSNHSTRSKGSKRLIRRFQEHSRVGGPPKIKGGENIGTSRGSDGK
jgi:hypothetical protein